MVEWVNRSAKTGLKTVGVLSFNAFFLITSLKVWIIVTKAHLGTQHKRLDRQQWKGTSGSGTGAAHQGLTFQGQWFHKNWVNHENQKGWHMYIYNLYYQHHIMGYKKLYSQLVLNYVWYIHTSTYITGFDGAISELLLYSRFSAWQNAKLRCLETPTLHSFCTRMKFPSETSETMQVRHQYLGPLGTQFRPLQLHLRIRPVSSLLDINRPKSLRLARRRQQPAVAATNGTQLDTADWFINVTWDIIKWY